MAWLIKGARLLDPARGVDRTGDLLVSEGKIAAIGGDIPKEGGTVVLDGKGLVLSPSFVDIHVHLREPGREDAETIESGTRAAAAGGFGTVACMPNTDPPLDSRSAIRFVLERAKEAGPVKVCPVGAITVGRKGQQLAEIGELVKAGAVAVSDDGDPVEDAGLMLKVLEYSKMFGIPVISHSEERQLSGSGVIHQGRMSARLGLTGIPAAAEEIAIERDVRLAEIVGGRLHIAHVSTAGGVDIIRRAKDRAVRVTGETAPHYLALTDQSLAGYDSNRKMKPPLRSAEDRDALRVGVADGTLDAIATDHAPHPHHEKEVEFDNAPFGVIGLETAMPVILTYLVRTGHLTLPLMVERLTSGPAGVIGLEHHGIVKGAPASLTLFDTESSWVVDPSAFQSLSRNTPFAGERLFGKVHALILGDHLLEPHLEKGAGEAVPSGVQQA